VQRGQTKRKEVKHAGGYGTPHREAEGPETQQASIPPSTQAAELQWGGAHEAASHARLWSMSSTASLRLRNPSRCR
jgi:hypothetical protein